MDGKHPPSRRLIVLGSTGSIGVNTLQVVAHLRATGAAAIDVVGLAAGRNASKLIEQARQFNVPAVAVADASQADEVRAALGPVTVYGGPDAALELVESAAGETATDTVAAVVGSAGLPATLAAAQRGHTIGLANKETLVAAGALITPMVRQHNARLIPVDSEHSAIFQCLHSGAGRQVSGSGPMHPARPDTRNPAYPIKRIVLTASGGPFRTADRATMQNATVEQAMQHPTWQMGPKITIDSATMMNKALEIVEAHWLFGLPAEKIEVIIHPQSMVHSFVEFADHSILAQMGPPDMRMPIQYALTYPNRSAGCSRALDWSKLRRLDFEPPDHDRFRSLKLAYEVIEAGGTAGAVFNAANEAAVAAFLDRKIRFGRIVELVAEALSAIEPRPVESLETVMAADHEARQFVTTRINHEITVEQ